MQITNADLYHLLQSFKDDMQEFKKDVYRRFDRLEKQYDDLRDDVAESKGDIKTLQEDVLEIKNYRNVLKLKFSYGWAAVSFFMAIMAAFLMRLY